MGYIDSADRLHSAPGGTLIIAFEVWDNNSAPYGGIHLIRHKHVIVY